MNDKTRMLHLAKYTLYLESTFYLHIWWILVTICNTSYDIIYSAPFRLYFYLFCLSSFNFLSSSCITLLSLSHAYFLLYILPSGPACLCLFECCLPALPPPPPTPPPGNTHAHACPCVWTCPLPCVYVSVCVCGLWCLSSPPQCLFFISLS